MIGGGSAGPCFVDRREAGALLAQALAALANEDVVVLGLPRGGIPVAFEVARALRAPLDVLVVRKLGFPGHEEFAMGAIASGGIRVMNDEIPEESLPAPVVVEGVVRRELLELERRERAYRGSRELVPVAGRVVVIVDDGLATGATMRAAVWAVRQRAARRVVVAVPVGSVQARQALERFADEVVCLRTPDPFTAVGLWYEQFSQTTDEEVAGLLATTAGDAAPRSEL